MIWEPTMHLRWSKDGKLQQRWYRQTVDYRTYNGVKRRCEGTESEWRDVPAETVSEGTNP